MHFHSLVSLGPLREFHGLAQLNDFVLELFNLSRALSLDVVNELVHEALLTLGGQVGPDDCPIDGVGGAVGVWTDEA